MDIQKRDRLAKLIVCSIALLIVASAVIVYFAVLRQRPQVGAKTVSITIECGGEVYSYNNINTDAEYVFDLLIEQNQPLELGLEYEQSAMYGAFVVSLKNTPQNAELGLYYTYTINGEFADGIQTQTIKDGDKIAFTLTQF